MTTFLLLLQTLQLAAAPTDAFGKSGQLYFAGLGNLSLSGAHAIEKTGASYTDSTGQTVVVGGSESTTDSGNFSIKIDTGIVPIAQLSVGGEIAASIDFGDDSGFGSIKTLTVGPCVGSPIMLTKTLQFWPRLSGGPAFFWFSLGNFTDTLSAKGAFATLDLSFVVDVTHNFGVTFGPQAQYTYLNYTESDGPSTSITQQRISYSLTVGLLFWSDARAA